MNLWRGRCFTTVSLTSAQIWELFEGKPLVRPPSPNTDVSSAVHLAKLIALLGPPPKELLKRGEASEQFFNENGECTLSSSAFLNSNFIKASSRRAS